jgi:hypothetical protein
MDVITFRNVLRGSSMINRSANYPRILCVLLVAALMALQAAGQSIVTGDAVGTVTDPSGAVIPGATVTLTNVGTNAVQATTTESNGFFRFSLLKPGPYKLEWDTLPISAKCAEFAPTRRISTGRCTF